MATFSLPQANSNLVLSILTGSTINLMLHQFRHLYPQGSLISELINIDRGLYIVKVSVQNEETIFGTGLAAAETIEKAEDKARERALMTVNLEKSAISPQTPQSQSEIISIPLDGTPPYERCAGMGGLQQTAINCEKPNIKPEKSPLSTPGEVASPKERPPRHDGACSDSWSTAAQTVVTATPRNQTSNHQSYNPPSVTLSPPEKVVSNPITTPEPNTQPEIADFVPTPITKEISLETTPAIESQSNIFDQPLTPPPPEEITPVEAGNTLELDFNEIRHKIDLEMKRLSWTKEQGRDYLLSTYGKRARLHLTDEELLEFWHYLENLPS
ncbi:conserved hypothetical protein [Hyella patelloides LEGE 07179]|uniref:Uncharacterized protein n=1 Tax=Hyella patelloides LEGE 07179 TaxID=945734 RepID=A0A563VVE9_9CYAN|nr:hypothetical protein [Hyella patelloides]VEP15376.1 conserved hypothetical protein [Hyella patelloides LEGE 07179]